MRADLERLQWEVGAAEAANREYEAKLERPRKERSSGTSFDGQVGGGSADLWRTAATTMCSTWTRGVSVGRGLRQGLFNLPRVVPKFPVECPPYVYIAPQIAVISCVDDAYLFSHFGEALVTEHRRVGGLFGVLGSRYWTVMY